MDLRAIALFLCMVTVATMAFRCRDVFVRACSMLSIVGFSAMVYIALKNYPGDIQGVQFHIMGMGAVFGLVFLFLAIAKTLVSTKKG